MSPDGTAFAQTRMTHLNLLRLFKMPLWRQTLWLHFWELHRVYLLFTLDDPALFVNMEETDAQYQALM